MARNPTVTAAEIARLAGVGRAAVSNWRRRHPDFPAPVGGTPTSPEFDLREVEAWLRAQGKLAEVSAEERLWRQILATGDDPCETLARVGDYLLGVERGDHDRTPDPRLKAVLDEVAAHATARGAQSTFDDLWVRLQHWPGLRTNPTPEELADVMVGLADVAGGTVLDPTCGCGGLLRAAARAGCAAAYGQDLDPGLARVADRWLALHQVPGGVQVGDSLRADAYAGQTVDAVVCAPPLGMSNWGHEVLAYDPRWVYGLPPRTEPELAWVQHALAHLRIGGSAVLLMPPAAARRRAGRRIRGELLRRGALRAVIALPAGAAGRHRVPLHLWVLRRPDPEESPSPRVLLVDTTAADSDLPEVYARVRDLYRRFAADPEQPLEEPGFARTVPLIELLDEEVDLTPGVRQPDLLPVDTRQRLARHRDEFQTLVTELPRLLPAVRGEATPREAATASVAELAKSGALQVIGPFRSTAREASPSEPAAVLDDRPVLTVDDVMRGQPASGRADEQLHPGVELLPGDVVVPVTARRLIARVVTESGALLGRDLYLLRPDPAALDAWFLAGHLRSSANARHTSSISSSFRIDVRRAQVPRLPLAEQRRLGEAFRTLDAFDRAVRRAAELGAELVRMTADGLARGSIRPVAGNDVGSDNQQ